MAQFSVTGGGQQQRLEAQLKLDFTWWNALLSQFNDIFFFNNHVKDVFQLYTDASLKELGDLFYHNYTKPRTEIQISQSEAFVAQTSNWITTFPSGSIIVPDIGVG